MLTCAEGDNMGYLDLTGKRAIVTGAAGGLCLSMAEGLMEAGASVCIIDINPGAEKTAQEMTDRGFQCSFVIADIADDKEREQAFSEAVKLLGGTLDIIVNGAGVQRRHKSEEFPMKDWKFVLDVNLTAVFSLCQMAAKQFMVQQTKGKIINIASMLFFSEGIQCRPMRHLRGQWHRSQRHSAMCGPRRGSMSMRWRRVIWLRR